LGKNSENIRVVKFLRFRYNTEYRKNNAIKKDREADPMEEEGKRTIAYLCPSCRQTVVVERTVFQLAAAPTQLPCPCGKSAVRTEMIGDHCQLTVPCLPCGKEHTVACSTHAFFHEKCLAFSCAASGLDCCYVGEENAVLAAMGRLEQALDKVETESGQRGAFLDEIIMHEVLSEIRDIAQRGGVSCACGSKEWGLQVNYSSVDLVCARCGGILRLPAATESDLEDVCCKHTLLIKRKD
jgi:hypothetical protein